MTRDELKLLLERGSLSFKDANKTNSQISHPKPQRDKAPALDGTNEGKKEGLQRIVVRFVGYRVRPVDPDNFAGSVKDVLDGLRHAGLIPGDEPWTIIFQTRQEKVRSWRDERTEIEIIYP